MKIRSFLSLLALFTTTITTSAQQAVPMSKEVIDSIKRSRLESAAILNPTLRQVTVSTDLIGRGNLEGELLGNPLFKGKASTLRTTIVLNMPIYSWGKNTVSLSGSFFQQEIRVDQVESPSLAVANRNFVFNKGTVGLTASFQRIDSIFGRPVFYMAGLTGVTNDIASIKRVSFLGTAVFPIKNTPKTRFSAGLVINIDPSLKVPAFVIFNYWHKFENKLELNFSLPQGVGIRRAFSDRLWANFGTSLGGSLAFFELNQPNLPRDANYTTIDLKTGIGVEYRVGKKMIFGLNSGVLTPLSARAFDRKETSSEYFLKNKLANVPYVNLSFSILPFTKRR